MSRGRVGGMGFSFRGYAPPWPYVGRGRGGYPRCWAYAPPFQPGVYSDYGVDYSNSGFYGFPGRPYGGSPVSSREEVAYLRNQAELLKEHLDEIETRIRDLESKKEDKE